MKRGRESEREKRGGHINSSLLGVQLVYLDFSEMRFPSSGYPTLTNLQRFSVTAIFLKAFVNSSR